ncbi:hypothetical protein [Succinimonas sp.]
MQRTRKLMRPLANRISRHRNPLQLQKRRNRQRRHVLYTIHIENGF